MFHLEVPHSVAAGAFERPFGNPDVCPGFHMSQTGAATISHQIGQPRKIRVTESQHIVSHVDRKVFSDSSSMMLPP